MGGQFQVQQNNKIFSFGANRIGLNSHNNFLAFSGHIFANLKGRVISV